MKRHTPYGSLRPVITPPLVFYTITIDFILALPLLKSEFNSIITLTYKFSKKVISALDKDI